MSGWRRTACGWTNLLCGPPDSRRHRDALMVTEAHSRPSAHPGGREFVGVVYGDVGSTALNFSVIRPVERNEFVQIPNETCGPVLRRVQQGEPHPPLSPQKAQPLGRGEARDNQEQKAAGGAVGG